MAIGFETFSLERTCTRTAFYAQSSDSPQRRKTRAMTSDLFFLHRSFFLHSILFSCFRQKIYITTCRALILVTLTFIGMATGNHVSARSRDEGGARGVGATTSRVSDSVIENNQGAGQMAVPHHGRRYDFTCVFQIPSQISILNLKSQPKSKFGQI